MSHVVGYGCSSPPVLPPLEGRWCARRLADKGALTSARHHGIYSRLAHTDMPGAADCLCVTDGRVNEGIWVCTHDLPGKGGWIGRRHLLLLFHFLQFNFAYSCGPGIRTPIASFKGRSPTIRQARKFDTSCRIAQKRCYFNYELSSTHLRICATDSKTGEMFFPALKSRLAFSM